MNTTVPGLTVSDLLNKHNIIYENKYTWFIYYLPSAFYGLGTVSVAALEPPLCYLHGSGIYTPTHTPFLVSQGF